MPQIYNIFFSSTCFPTVYPATMALPAVSLGESLEEFVFQVSWLNFHSFLQLSNKTTQKLCRREVHEMEEVHRPVHNRHERRRGAARILQVQVSVVTMFAHA